MDCCVSFDETSAGKCESCQKPICAKCEFEVEEVKICDACAKKLQSEIEETAKLGGIDLPKALLGAVIGSAIGSLIWVGIVILTKYEIGYMAVGLGWLTGTCAYWFTGKRSKQLAPIVVACFIISMILMKYLVFSYLVYDNAMNENPGGEINYFFMLNKNFLQYFIKNIRHSFSFFDILWFGLGISSGVKAISPQYTITKSSDEPVDTEQN